MNIGEPAMDLRGLFKNKDTAQEYTVTDKSGISGIGSNKILGDTTLLDDADKISIVFKGRGNILYLEKGIKHLRRLDITFTGDNNLIYLSKSRHEYILKIEAESDSVCFFGPQLFTSKTKAMIAKVRQGDFLLTGADGLFSLAIELDTKSPDGSGHGDILIGDHVWLGQSVKVYGGSTIESRAVLGAQAVVCGSECSGNACWVTRRGELTKILDNIVFTKDSMRAVPADSLQEFDSIDDDIKQQIFDINGPDLEALAAALRQIKPAMNRLKYIRKLDKGRVPDRTPLISDSVLQFGDEETAAADHNGKDRGNKIIGSLDESAGNSVEFEGTGNILFIEPGAELEGCRIIFKYDNSLVYLSRSDKPYHLLLYMHHNTTAFIGRNVHTPEKPLTRVIVSEAKSVVIGEDVRFGKRVWMRTSDQHPIYDIESGRRLNKAGNIVIGDGARIPADAVIRKGSVIAGTEEEAGASLAKLADALSYKSSAEKRLIMIQDYADGYDLNKMDDRMGYCCE